MLPHTRQCIATKTPVNVVYYGDSISQIKPDWNGGGKTPEANWGAVLVARLNALFPDSPFTAHHFGVGGQNTEEGLARIDALAMFKPDMVLVAFGANDCCYHWLEPEQTKRTLISLTMEIKQRFDADVVLVGTGGDNPEKPFFRHLEETLLAQKEAAEETKVPFVDIRSAILNATENGKHWDAFHINEENCHPTNRGHQVWAQTALDSVQPHLDYPRPY